MNATESPPAVSEPRRRWYRLTPDRFVIALLVVEGFLLLSERFHWFPKGFAVLIAVASVGVAMLLIFLWLIIAPVVGCGFQYSLRTLLVFVLVVAIACSWLTVMMQKAKRQNELVAHLSLIKYDYECNAFGSPISGAQPGGPRWLWQLFGADFFADVVSAYVSTNAELERAKGLSQLKWLDVQTAATDGPFWHPTPSDDFGPVSDSGLAHLKGMTQLRGLQIGSYAVTDAGMEHLKGLTQLESLRLLTTHITDAGLEHLKGLTNLRRLLLQGPKISDAGLERLKRLTKLQELDLHCNVTDAGLKSLKKFTELRELNLVGCRVTDDGLEDVKGFTQLQKLCLWYTQVTNRGVKKLQQALPNCEIHN